MAMVRLATFNLLHGMPVPGAGAGEASGTDRLRSAAREVDADVLALQEVDREQPRSGEVDQTAVVASALEARSSRFVATVLGTPGVEGWRPAPDGDGAEPPTGPTYGIALVSRYPVRRWAVRRFGAAPGRLPLVVPGAGRSRVLLVPDEPRAALAAVVAGPHAEFTVVATHLSFVPGFNVRQLRAIARWARAMPSPRFLLGDLNIPGRLPARLTGWTSLASEPTYPAARPRVQLDHVLADGLPAGAVRGTHVRELDLSDHRALSVDLDL